MQQQEQGQQQVRGKPRKNQNQYYYTYQVTAGRLSEKTKYEYTRNINEFLEFFKLKDTVFLQDNSPKLLKQMVRDYVIHLRENRKLKRKSIKTHVAAIASFLTRYVMMILRQIGGQVRRMTFHLMRTFGETRAYTIEEIRKMLSVCHRIRDKVIIHLLGSTGMRLGAVHTLKYGDLTLKQTKQGNVYKIEVYSGTSASYSAVQ